jgi:glycosyltransferase involved in cell wall biosynthesis
VRVGIDVRYLSHGLVGGVHSYVAHFVPALVDLARGHQIYLYADDKRPFELRDLPDYVTVRVLPYRTPLSSVYHDLFLHRSMQADRLDVAHFPANYGFGPANTRTVITLHDVLNILPLQEIWRGLAHSVRNPRSLAMTAYLHWFTGPAIARAHQLLTVSEYSRREIARQGGFDVNRISVAPNAPAPGLCRVVDPVALDKVRRRHQLTRPFVLADALKNPASLVRAWRMQPAAIQRSHHIVFFSRRADLLPIVHEAVADGSARLLMRPSDGDLAALYSMADAFAFPSMYEGFGLPIIEAMMCGAPVIAANVHSIPEVAGGAALLFDPQDATQLAQHLTVVLSTPEEARRLRERGLVRAADFTWRKTAQRILESYETVLHSAVSTPGAP